MSPNLRKATKTQKKSSTPKSSTKQNTLKPKPSKSEPCKVSLADSGDEDDGNDKVLNVVVGGMVYDKNAYVNSQNVSKDGRSKASQTVNLLLPLPRHALFTLLSFTLLNKQTFWNCANTENLPAGPWRIGDIEKLVAKLLKQKGLGCWTKDFGLRFVTMTKRAFSNVPGVSSKSTYQLCELINDGHLSMSEFTVLVILLYYMTTTAILHTVAM